MEIWYSSLSLAALVLGAVAGSVANAVIYRLPRGVSWLRGQSECVKCQHKLEWRDLVPVVSYVALGGRCRYCQKPIGFRYLGVELVMAGGFWLLMNRVGVNKPVDLVILLAIFWVTVVIAAMDWETKLVSEAMVGMWGGLVWLGYWGNWGSWDYVSVLAGVLVGLLVIGGVWAVSRGRGMGFGDVEIAVVLGGWLGWPKVAVAMWMAFVAGAGVGLVLLAVKRSRLKSEIAFGPFLVWGGWVAFLFGESIVGLISWG